MPQMSPLLWFYLYIYWLMLLILFMVLLYFVVKDYQVKMNFKEVSIVKNKYLWLW